MALFTVRVEVDSFLQLQRPEREALQSIAASLRALVDKVNEPDPEPEPDQQPALDTLVAKLAESNTTLADEVAKILAANP